jgi:hypothetical protein
MEIRNILSKINEYSNKNFIDKSAVTENAEIKNKKSLKDYIQLNENVPGQQLTIKPMPGASQLQDPATGRILATGPADKIKTLQGSIAKGEVNLAPAMKEEQLDEKWGTETIISPEEKGKYTGKSKKELLKMYNMLKSKGPHKKKSPEYSKMRELSFAIRAKSGWGKVQEQNNHDLLEGDIPSDQMDMGAGLGAGRSDSVLEQNMIGMSDELAAKKITDKIMGTPNLSINKIKEYVKRYLGMVNKSPKDVDALAALVSANLEDKGLLETTKKIKQKVNENMHKHTSARLLGKSHALAKEGYNCKFDNMDEARHYHEGYKEGLDECYGQRPIVGLVSETDSVPSTISGMADQEMQTTMEARVTSHGMDFICNQIKDFLESQGRTDLDNITEDDIIGALDETEKGQKLWQKIDILSSRDYHKIIDDIMNACKDRSVDDVITEIGLDEVSRGEYIKQQDKKAERQGKNTFTAFGQTFDTDDVNETNMAAFESWDKQLLNLLNENTVSEGMSISISKGNQGSPDSVTVSAQDNEAEELLNLIKQSGLGLFQHDNEISSPDKMMYNSGGIDVVGDHDGMMSLIRKLSHAPHQESDYEDENSHEMPCHEDSHVDENLMGAALGAAAGSALTKTPAGANLGARIGSELGDMVSEENCNECGYMESKCECEGKLDEVESSDQMAYEVAESEQLAELSPELLRRAADKATARSNDLKQYSREPGARQVSANKLASHYQTKAYNFDSEANRRRFEREQELAKQQLQSKASQAAMRKAGLEEASLNEWANEAGKIGTDAAFEQDIEFMTKVISGGLNKPKSTGQTTVPVIAGQDSRMEDPMSYAKLAGIKK